MSRSKSFVELMTEITTEASIPLIAYKAALIRDITIVSPYTPKWEKEEGFLLKISVRVFAEVTSTVS